MLLLGIALQVCLSSHRHSPANSLPLLSCYCLHPILQCPELGSSSAGERSQLHKPTGAALHKCPGLKQCSLNDLYSQHLFHALDPSVCAPGAVKSLQVVLSCSNHRPPPADTSEEQDARSQPCFQGAPCTSLQHVAVMGQSGLALLPFPVFNITHFTL